METPFTLSESQFNRIFPFYIRLNRQLQVIAAGSSFSKLCEWKKGTAFSYLFSIIRPHQQATDFETVLSLQNQLVIIEAKQTRKFLLRGQFEYLPESNELIFVGSPWFGTIEEVRERNLVFADFAFHDPLIDLLHVLKTQEITNEDLKQLIDTINKQKKDLQRVNKEVHDIALFPMQNPDPLIRINLEGDILSNNPAAASLDFIEFENKLIRNDEFFRLIAERIDRSNPRWVTEASSNNRFYSFLCIYMPQEKYINIYGRDISERKRNENEITRLSRVASANENGVLFASPDGKITWANEGFCKLTGYGLDEIIGKSPVELCNGPLTDENTQGRILEAFFNGQGFSEDIIYHRKDRSWFWGHSVAQPIKNEKGVIVEFFGIIQNITNEKANQEKLKVLSQIAEDNINAVVIADATGRITWVNKSFVKMTGYSLEEAIGKKPGQLLQGPETNPDTVKYLGKQISRGEPFNTEILNYRKNGSKYWLRVQGQPIRDEMGNITGFFALEEDITREKESELRFRKALENIGDNVWEYDLRTGKIYFSKPENEFLGYANDEMADDQDLWRKSIHKDDIHLLEEADLRYRNSQSESHNLEYRMIDRSGNIKWVLDRGVVIEKGKDGKPVRITGTHTDITNIKQIETELSNRVSQFQSLSENIPGVIYEFEFRPDGTEGIRYISPAIERVFGIKPELFKNYLNYIHPDDREEVISKNLQSRNTLQSFYAETRLLIPGQPLKWHSVHSSFSYKTESGSYVFTGFMLDITERKQAEQQLEEQRRFYEDILNNMPADIAVFNASHQYLFVNPRGIKDEALRKWIIGKRDEDYCAHRNKPLSIAEVRRNTFNKVLHSKKTNEWEERILPPGGEEQYVLRRMFPVLDNNGEVSLVIGYGLDITERKKFEVALKTNEAKYRGIIANMNLGLMEMDTNGRIEFANHTLLTMAGLTEKEAPGYDAGKFLPSLKQATVKTNKKRKKDTTEAYEEEISINGKNAWWFVSSAPKYASNGELIGSIVICLDITNQKKLEKELIKSKEKAEQLTKAKKMFLANMSHEIRTPMNAIVGMAGQLNKTTLNNDQQHYLDIIRSASDNLLVTINDILDLSKIEAGKLSLENIGFEPREIISRLMQVMKHKAEEKGLAFTNSFCDSRLFPVLIGDPYRLNQVLLNLISNAIKFTEKGWVDITCEVIDETETHQVVKASVKDSGIGMEKSFVKKLFQKFSQEDESVTRKFGGTGLGMSIFKELVDLMKGTISVESKKGKGTHISFTISFEKGSHADLPQKFSQLTGVSVLTGKKILVADDNPMNRMVASAILKNYGVEIIMANDGKEAVESVNRDHPHLVLMDVQMPEMDGLEATRHIRNQGHKLPVIALTAFAIKGDNEKCLAAGMNDYLSKPFEETQFINVVSNWLSTPEKAAVPVTTKFSANNSDEAGKPLYSLTKIKELSSGNEAFVKDMVKVFIEQSAWAIEQFEKALTDDDALLAKKTAHRMKPSIKTMCIHTIEEQVLFIENNAEKVAGLQELEKQIRQVIAVLKDVTALLTKTM